MILALRPGAVYTLGRGSSGATSESMPLDISSRGAAKDFLLCFFFPFRFLCLFGCRDEEGKVGVLREFEGGAAGRCSLSESIEAPGGWCGSVPSVGVWYPLVSLTARGHVTSNSKGRLCSLFSCAGFLRGMTKVPYGGWDQP